MFIIQPRRFEYTIEQYAVDKVRGEGGEARKVKWLGVRGAPDRMFIMKGYSFFIEFKKEGIRLSSHQIREHQKLLKGGIRIYVARTKDDVNDAFKMEEARYKESL